MQEAASVFAPRMAANSSLQCGTSKLSELAIAAAAPGRRPARWLTHAHNECQRRAHKEHPEGNREHPAASAMKNSTAEAGRPVECGLSMPLHVPATGTRQRAGVAKVLLQKCQHRRLIPAAACSTVGAAVATASWAHLLRWPLHLWEGWIAIAIVCLVLLHPLIDLGRVAGVRRYMPAGETLCE